MRAAPLTLSLLLVSLPAPAGAAPGAPTPTTAGNHAACPPVLPADARCGTVRVPGAWEAPAGDSLDLAWVVLPARSGAPAPDPVVVLLGGPGQASTGFVEGFSRALEGVGEERDLVFVDQRGTGGEGRLQCPLPDDLADWFGEFLHPPTVADCHARLAARHDLRRYGTPDAVRDLDRAREALGYERWNVYGVSYGTRLAQEYVRRYPQRSRTVTLVGTIPPGTHQPASYATGLEGALERLVADCAADRACATAAPDLAGDVERIFRSLAERPATVTVVDPRSGGAVEGIRYGAGDFAYTLRSLLYGPGALRLPAMVTEAARTGDLGAFARARAERMAGLPAHLAFGLYLSVMCSEEVHFVGPDEERAVEDTRLGPWVVRTYREACERWPVPPVDASFHEPLDSPVPALLFAGARDPSTTPAMARAAAAGFHRSLALVFPQGGHNFTGAADGEACRRAVVERFIEAGAVDGLDAGCMEGLEPLPFRTSPR